MSICFNGIMEMNTLFHDILGSATFIPGSYVGVKYLKLLMSLSHHTMSALVTLKKGAHSNFVGA